VKYKVFATGTDLNLLKKSLEEADISSLFLSREIDKVLVALVDFLNPVRQSLDRRPGSGEGFLVRKRAPNASDADDVNDTDTFTEGTGDYTEIFSPYKTIGTQGKVSRRVQKTGRSLADLLREEMESQAREVRNAEETRIYFGNHPVVNGKQWDGLAKVMDDNVAQIVALTTSGLGGDFTLEKMDEMLDRNIGNPGLIVTSRAGRRKINAALQAQQRFIDRTEIAGGFRVTTYNDIPVVPTTNIPDTIQFDSSGKVTSLTGGSSTLIFSIDLQDVFMSVLTELTTMPLARISSQFETFDIFMDETLVVRDSRHVSMLAALKIL